jgi:DNA-binding NarL/FixJ family response regulator
MEEVSRAFRHADLSRAYEVLARYAEDNGLQPGWAGRSLHALVTSLSDEERSFVQSGFEAPSSHDRPGRRSSTPTRQELRVLLFAMDGLTSTEAAARLCISPHTEKVHRRHLLARLGARNMVEAAAIFLRGERAA